jgi:hypothetical protein
MKLKGSLAALLTASMTMALPAPTPSRLRSKSGEFWLSSAGSPLTSADNAPAPSSVPCKARAISVRGLVVRVSSLGGPISNVGLRLNKLEDELPRGGIVVTRNT